MSTPSPSHYDVIVGGGALAGAATAILLLCKNPQLRVLVIERSEAFSRRVGEATVEVSAFFLGRVLGLTDHLNHCHLMKQGMRFWFQNQDASCLADSSEIGGRYLARVPSYQVDRAVLDQEVLSRAQALGAEVRRPAAVKEVVLRPGELQTVKLSSGNQTQTLDCRWFVDASGVAALLARQQGWWRANSQHPTSAAWARWTGVQNWDGLELAGRYPDWAAACYGIRGTATNHIVGRGWWAWCIPLKGGDVSIGLVFDERLVEWPREGPLGERLKNFLDGHPVTRELLKDARCREGDVHWRRYLPYTSTTFAGDGFVLVGDAAAFIDPFYSPGMDGVAFTTSAAAQLIQAERSGEHIAELVERHNQNFTVSYRRWFEALYQNKYEYMGDFELMRLAFILDIGLYYLGVASQPFKYGAAALKQPLFSTRASVPFFHLIRAYNRRLAAIARSRHNRGVWGRANAHRRFMFPGYTFSRGGVLSVAKGLLGWAKLELREGWRTWFSNPIRFPMPEVLPISKPEQSQMPLTHQL